MSFRTLVAGLPLEVGEELTPAADRKSYTFGKIAETFHGGRVRETGVRVAV